MLKGCYLIKLDCRRGTGRAESREQELGKQQQDANQVREHRKKGGEKREQWDSVK